MRFNIFNFVCVLVFGFIALWIGDILLGPEDALFYMFAIPGLFIVALLTSLKKE